MRLLALDLGPGMRGGQRQTSLLLAGLAARGHDLRLVARRESLLAAAARSSGLDVVEVPAGGEASPSLLLAAARAARSFRPDVVYTGDAHGHGVAVFSLAAARTPLVVHRRVTFAPRTDPFSRFKYRAATRYLAVSEAVASSLERAGVARRAIAVVPDGLPDSAFREGPSPPTPPFRLVHVGAFDGMKGQEVVVEVVARLVASGLDVAAEFLGSGTLRPAVEARAGEIGVGERCTFAGHVEDVASALARSHLLLLPSASEGGPLALVEAMAAGCVAVGHDVGGSREMTAGGTAGVLVPSLDPAQWLDAVRALLLDPGRRAALVAAGRRVAGERTIARTVERVEAELAAAAERRA